MAETTDKRFCESCGTTISPIPEGRLNYFRCPVCGSVVSANEIIEVTYEEFYEEDCPACNGTGDDGEGICRICGGSGIDETWGQY